MPSKIEHELTKFRGKMSDTDEVYTDTVATLKDLITSLETIVTALDADLTVNKQKTNKAMRKAAKGVAMANASVQKVAGTLTECVLDECIIGYGDLTKVPYTTGGKIIYYNNKLYFMTGSSQELITSAVVE